MLNKILTGLLILSLSTLAGGQYYLAKVEKRQFQIRLRQMHDLSHLAGREAMLRIIDSNMSKICEKNGTVYISRSGERFSCTKAHKED